MTHRRAFAAALIALAISGGLVIWVSPESRVSALGWVLLASIAGIVATGPIGRRIIAIVIAVSGVGIGLLGWSLTWQGGVSLLAAGLAIGVAIVTWVGGAAWPGMSRRYTRATDRPADPWSELDAGRDPTA